ncbi:hypothetical protein AMECASPLE_027667 [Ameca splendens]|uniref:C-type lectin domain-containing protein n=1 Tax=Ameca splendens TaxID=208324 RepID=A0ABV1ACP6_9TELE
MEKTRNLENQTENVNKTLNSTLSFFTCPGDGFCTNKTSELCQRGWIPFKEKCYLFSSTFCKTWKECQHFCQEMGADVAVIDNLQEWEFISKNIQLNYGFCDPYWSPCMGYYCSKCIYTWIQLQVGRVDVPGLVYNQWNFIDSSRVPRCPYRFVCEDEALIVNN